MKRYFPIFVLGLVLMLTSCQTRIVNAEKPMRDNSLALYKRYSIQTNDAKTTKVKVLKVDADKIYGKNTKGEDVVINRNEVREVKKFDLFSSIAIGLVAVAAFIFAPV
ncbi:MAG: bacteriophage spanin2 family protein [Bergeyella sp.]